MDSYQDYIEKRRKMEKREWWLSLLLTWVRFFAVVILVAVFLIFVAPYLP